MPSAVIGGRVPLDKRRNDERREQRKQEKAERGERPPAPGEDPDIAGIVPGPQPPQE